MYPLYGKGDSRGYKCIVGLKKSIYRPLAEGLMAFDGAKQASFTKLDKQ